MESVAQPGAEPTDNVNKAKDDKEAECANDIGSEAAVVTYFNSCDSNTCVQHAGCSLSGSQCPWQPVERSGSH